MKISAPPKTAAGPKAVVNALRMAFKSMNVFKTVKLLSKLNQKGGVDCPGCAWGDPNKRATMAEYCENGVKAIAEEATDQTIGPKFFRKYSIPSLIEKSDYWLGQQGRLVHPMVLENGNKHYTPISWDGAFKLIGKNLQELDHPDEAIFYTSGRTSNEAAFLYQLFVRMFGTNNMPDCSNMCHESSGVALTKTTGIGKGSVTLNDFPKADLILIFGQNPGTNHPRMLTSLEEAKRNGAKIVSINPLKETGLLNFKNPQKLRGWVGKGTQLTDIYLQIKINEDVALLKAIMIKLLKKAQSQPEILDYEFIKNSTDQFQEFKEDLDQYNLQELISRTGISEQEIDRVVDYVAERRNIIACWAMGLTQHVNGVDNIQEIVNLLLLKGSIGRPGAGTCPVRGHSNVQGDRTVGISERPSKELLDKLAKVFEFDPPRNHGFSVVEAIKAMHEKKAKVFLALGGNFLPASPDTKYTTEALQKCNLTVHISTKLNRSHLYHGKTALILPCLARSDRDVSLGKRQVISVENSMGVVHSSQGILSPPSKQLISEPEIIAGIAKATIKQSKIDWDYLVEDYDRIRELIERTISGFTNFNEQLKKDKGFALPNGARTRMFDTTNKKANFSRNKLSENKLSDDEYLLMTIRSHDQFNTTIYGLDDRYRGVFNGRRIIFMNRSDIKNEGYEPGDLLTLFNEYDGILRKVENFKIVPYDIPGKCIAAYYPETNPLVPLNLFARHSLTPASKSVKVKIKKA